MRSHYEYKNGEVVYAVEDGVVVIDKRDGEPSAKSFQVMPDIEPYKSMIDGRMITSRSRHREHLRDHGMVEVGNDSSLRRSPKPMQSPPGLQESIIRAYNEVQSRASRARR